MMSDLNMSCQTVSDFYLRNTISKKMRNLNVKLNVKAWFKFCYIIGLKDLPTVSLMWCRCNYLPVNCVTRVFYKMSSNFTFLVIIRTMFFPPYFCITFCLFYIGFIARTSSLVNYISFVFYSIF